MTLNIHVFTVWSGVCAPEFCTIWQTVLTKNTRWILWKLDFRPKRFVLRGCATYISSIAASNVSSCKSTLSQPKFLKYYKIRKCQHMQVVFLVVTTLGKIMGEFWGKICNFLKNYKKIPKFSHNFFSSACPFIVQAHCDSYYRLIQNRISTSLRVV